MLGPQRSKDISPTAHYTSYVWGKHGLSDPALVTRTGHLLYRLAQPTVLASQLVGGPTLEGFLLARHRVIDHLLAEAIDAGRVTQVLEVAAGLSPRGLTFARRYGDRLTYIEGDLPDMAASKQAALERAGAGSSERHRVVELDALSDDSFEALAQTLDPAGGLAIVTEGLLNYFDRQSVLGMWGRFARTLRRFPQGLYLSDLHLGGELPGRLSAVFGAALSVFVRGRLHMHFDDEAEAIAALEAAGFDRAVLHRPAEFADRLEDTDRPGAELVRVIEARRPAPTRS